MKLIDLCSGSEPLPFERERKSKRERACRHLARRSGCRNTIRSAD